MNGIGDTRLWRNRFILCFTLVLSSLLLPRSTYAVTTVDFSNAKDFFQELHTGEKISGDLADKGMSNPYAGSGVVKGYKMIIPKDVDPKNLELSVQSCVFQLAFICAGDAFEEKMYVLDSNFKPMEKEFKFKERMDVNTIDIPKDRILYILIGSENNSSGQYTLAFAPKEVK